MSYDAKDPSDAWLARDLAREARDVERDAAWLRDLAHAQRHRELGTKALERIAKALESRMAATSVPVATRDAARLAALERCASALRVMRMHYVGCCDRDREEARAALAALDAVDAGAES